ncbi:MAG: hypothetical protein LBJ62_03970 [Bifidobacteriaceae bacterium]|jgi:hypothetical protein|nr:hypothetical protein [Bifidobacteriaceae bacterium]
MRTPALSAQVAAAEMASFAALTARPLIIAGNGPSAGHPPADRLPGDAVVFRINWFFLEPSYRFGQQVDAWFSAVPNQTMQTMLAEQIAAGRYQVDRICTPMRLAPGDGSTSDRPADSCPQFDSWAPISQHARLARHFMSRPGLPTTGLQALGFALAVGFGEIYLSGIDLYEDPALRYCYRIPPRAAQALKAHDKTPGYEPNHSRDSDLAFLLACQAEFPQARVYSVSDSAVLNQILPPAPAPPVGGSPGQVVPKVSALPDAAPSATSTTPGQVSDGPGPERVSGVPSPVRAELAPAGRYPASAIKGNTDGPPYQVIDGRKCAYLTLVSAPDYVHGGRALARSLRQVSDVPVIALVTPDVPANALTGPGVFTATAEPIANPYAETGSTPARFGSVFTKLHAWRADFLDRMIFLDADTVILKNIDHLFQMEGLAAAPDWGLELTDQFNTGLFATEPSRHTFLALLQLMGQVPSPDGGDQGFLNSCFPSWQRLDPGYNCLVRLASAHPELFREQDVAVLHFVGPKPWQAGRSEPGRAQLERQWLSFLDPQELRDLVFDLRSSGPAWDGRSGLARHLAAAARRAGRDGRFNAGRRLRRAVRLLDPAVAASRAAPLWDRWPFRVMPERLLKLAVALKQAGQRVA